MGTAGLIVFYSRFFTCSNPHADRCSTPLPWDPLGSPWISVAPETGNILFETVLWLKRQNGKPEMEKNKRSAQPAKRRNDKTGNGKRKTTKTTKTAKTAKTAKTTKTTKTTKTAKTEAATVLRAPRLRPAAARGARLRGRMMALEIRLLI